MADWCLCGHAVSVAPIAKVSEAPFKLPLRKSGQDDDDGLYNLLDGDNCIVAWGLYEHEADYIIAAVNERERLSKLRDGLGQLLSANEALAAECQGLRAANRLLATQNLVEENTRLTEQLRLATIDQANAEAEANGLRAALQGLVQHFGDCIECMACIKENGALDEGRLIAARAALEPKL